MQVDRVGDAGQDNLGLRSVEAGQPARRHGWTVWLSLVLGGWLVAAVPLVAGVALSTAASVAVAGSGARLLSPGWPPVALAAAPNTSWP